MLLRIMLTMTTMSSQEKTLAVQEKMAASHCNQSKYRCNNNHILTKSAVVECLFSRAKIVLCDKKHRGMTPHLVEMLLCLYYNKDLWTDADVHKGTVEHFKIPI